MTHPFFNHRRHRHPNPPPPFPWPFPEPQPVPPPPTGGSDVSWPTFTGTAQFVGTSPNQQVSVYVDPSLGPQGFDSAQALLADADRIAALNNTIFGLTGVSPVNVVVFALNGVTDGTGGADHASCDFITGGNIEVDVSEGNPDRVSSLFEAELSECAMNGQLCGLSTGEALSRWCAMVTSNNALSDFETVSAWVQAGKPDWVNQTEGTDQDPVSIGCGMAFLSWVISTGNTLPAIAQAMVRLGNNGTLAQLYADVTGDMESDALSVFMAAFDAVPDTNTDDPFNSLSEAIASA